MRRASRLVAFGAVLGALLSSTGYAQRRGVAEPAPSRADSLLAVGRLAAAEDELYANVTRRPRSPAPRGALGLYLASRARFRIAEVLFWEAVRFGADSASARRAIAMMAPYRARGEGAAVAVPLRPTNDPRSLGTIGVRLGRSARDELSAHFDPSVAGVVVGRGVRAPTEIWVGERRVAVYAATVDSLLAPSEVRVGLDVLWPHHPRVDERAGTLTLGRPVDVASITGRVDQIPFVLEFPGLLLVTRPGVAPVSVTSRAGRALLRGTRWQIDPAQATVVVER